MCVCFADDAYLIFISTVAEMGDDLSDAMNEESLLISNHQSTADVPTLMYCLQNKNKVIDRILWIMDILFKPTHFGWVSNYRGDFFIKQVYQFILSCAIKV